MQDHDDSNLCLLQCVVQTDLMRVSKETTGVCRLQLRVILCSADDPSITSHALSLLALEWVRRQIEEEQQTLDCLKEKVNVSLNLLYRSGPVFDLDGLDDLYDLVIDGVGLAGFRAGPMLFYWPGCSLPFCLLLFSLSRHSFYGMVLSGWGLRTDMVLITLSQPCIANLFLIIILIVIIIIIIIIIINVCLSEITFMHVSLFYLSNCIAFKLKR